MTLARAVAGGMAVQAARMGEYLAEFGKQRRRPRRGIGNRCKAFHARETIRCRVGNGIRGQHARRQNHDRDEELNAQIELHLAS
jgi:hypothetical protein